MRSNTSHRRWGAGRFVGGAVMVGLLIAILIAPIAAAITTATRSGAAALTETIPTTFLAPDLPARSTVLASDGSELATFFRQDREEVRLDQVAAVFKDAVLATEDARFYNHGAVDLVGILRALATNIAEGGVVQGGSTLTQQFVKQSLVSRANGAEAAETAATETTVSRKLREIGLAIAVEERLSKDEIFEQYLNLVYFGNSAYGIEIAARRYFATTAADLALPQAALLAGLIKGPSTFDPVRNPAAAAERRSLVLRRMVAAGSIDEDQASQADGSPLGLDLTPPLNGCAVARHPYFCSYVLAEIRATEGLGATADERLARLLDGGLTVRTTLDPVVQDAAVAAVKDHIGVDHKIATAIVMTEPGTGAVRAIAQNRRWGEGKRETTLNFALDESQGGSAGFQAGSTFKPFVMTAALDQDTKASLYLNAPSEITVDGFENCRTDAPFAPYTVGNYDDSSYGAIDMSAAAAMSVNTYFVQLAERTGTCAPPKLAESMGLMRADGEPLSRVPSFVLGVDEVSPLRMAEAYATLAADGMHCDSHAITSITSIDGIEIDPPKVRCERAIDADVAHEVTGLLEDVISGDNVRRTGAAMALGNRPAAGKTGTTNNVTAVWFAGYTRDLAAAVWAGYPGSSKPLRDVTIRGETYAALFGGALPGPIWRDAMIDAHKGVKPRELVARDERS
ncbi:transglycosylase domain-containing protein [Sporichthya sp.]|uniref:transglycosylase domain-containing protein n=1 Tax=Sporichthya sp. TaxID=65475 RepID=UPI0018218BF5|nr:transglycosylase domain-containing protein [Sporichthya sp.]MBA3742552.1 transglycosylase domain-containing protein [Sporichthya sp.]